MALKQLTIEEGKTTSVYNTRTGDCLEIEKRDGRFYLKFSGVAVVVDSPEDCSFSVDDVDSNFYVQ